MEMVKKIDSAIMKILWAIVIACFIVMLVLVAGQVLSRLTRIQVLAPPDEIVTLVFVWFGYIGATIISREHTHLRVELLDGFVNKTPKRKAIYSMILATLNGVFLVVLWRSSWTLFIAVANRRSPMLSWPQRIWYSPLLVSTACMLAFCVWDILLGLKTLMGKQS